MECVGLTIIATGLICNCGGLAIINSRLTLSATEIASHEPRNEQDWDATNHSMLRNKLRNGLRNQASFSGKKLVIFRF
jgi:hypothetical protein